MSLANAFCPICHCTGTGIHYAHCPEVNPTADLNRLRATIAAQAARIAVYERNVESYEHNAAQHRERIAALTQERDDLIMGRTENHAHITSLIAERDQARSFAKEVSETLADHVEQVRHLEAKLQAVLATVT